jgi:ABC-type branched-subunit amino acid transport system ATPase component
MTSSMSADPFLEVKDVVFSYSGARAVDGCSYQVAEGTITGVIGPNGAGKSTMMELLSGSLKPMSGSIRFRQVEIGGCGPVAAARLGIARTFQIPRLFNRLPVMENVLIGAPNQRGERPTGAILRRRAWRSQESVLRKEALEILKWLGLHDHFEAPAGALSGGQRKLLEIARAMMAHPSLLLLDEPTAGVFPELALLISERVREISRQGVTVLVVAHNMGWLSAISDEVVVMAEGKVLTRGTLEVVRQHSEVISAYLGVGSNTRIGTSHEESSSA